MKFFLAHRNKVRVCIFPKTLLLISMVIIIIIWSFILFIQKNSTSHYTHSAFQMSDKNKKLSNFLFHHCSFEHVYNVHYVCNIESFPLMMDLISLYDFESLLVWFTFSDYTFFVRFLCRSFFKLHFIFDDQTRGTLTNNDDSLYLERKEKREHIRAMRHSPIVQSVSSSSLIVNRASSSSSSSSLLVIWANHIYRESKKNEKKTKIIY